MLKQGDPESVGISRKRIDTIDARVRRWIDDGITPSIVVLVARRGVIVMHSAYGRLGPEPDAPSLGVSAIFPLASISKVIAATAVMMLVEDGLVGLNRPVQEYIPHFVGDGKKEVMVHHLLTHTSGLVDKDAVAHQERNRGKVTIPPAEPNEHPTVHELLWLKMDAPLTRKPGEQMSYSGTGYGLLTEIIRRASGLNLGEFARKRIFAPLGMADTFYDVPKDRWDRVVRRDPAFPDQFKHPSVSNFPSGSVGGYSTAMDMARFCQTFLDKGRLDDVRLLSPASVREMTRGQTPRIASLFKEDFEAESSRGYGWDVKGDKKPRFHASLDSRDAFTHQGAGGVSIMVDPAVDLVVVFFSVSKGVMAPHLYTPAWTMDLLTNMVIASID